VKIRMTVDISGTRNGVDWPRRGAVVDLPDDEARGYVESGMATPVPDFKEERAVVPPAEHRAELPPAVDDEPEPEPEVPTSGLTTKNTPTRRTAARGKA
jgi:hypothetical protein